MTDTVDFTDPTKEEIEAAKRAEWFADARALLDVLEGTDLPIPSKYQWSGITYFVWSKEMFQERARQLGGHRDKEVGDYYYDLNRTVGQFSITISVPRTDVCEQKVVGVKEVERDVRVGEDYRPFVTEIVQEDIIEWVCPDSLLEDE